MFLKWIKRNKLKIIATGICSIAMAIFTIISFSCKTYAYSIDNNGNLIGDNVFDVNSVQLGNGYDYQVNASDWVKAIDIPVLPNTTYASSSNIGRYAFNNGNIVSNYNQSTITTSNDTNSLSLFFYVGDYSGTPYQWFSNYMLNIGDISKPWEPYGVWYSENNYNAVIEDNEELIEQINTKNTKELQSGIKANLQGTNLKVYNQQHMELTNMLTTTPFYQEQITFTNDQLNYDMSINNTEVYNAILNNNGEFMNGQQLTTDYPTLLYTFKTPLYIEALTFSRGDTTGTRYINIYFTDNSSTELLLSEGSENNRTDITWTNETKKYVKYISTTAEVGFNLVELFTIPNSSQIYTSGYEQGYTDGWYESYQAVADNIQNANQNLQAKYNEGYNEGYQKGASSNNSLYNMVIRS